MLESRQSHPQITEIHMTQVCIACSNYGVPLHPEQDASPSEGEPPLAQPPLVCGWYPSTQWHGKVTWTQVSFL